MSPKVKKTLNIGFRYLILIAVGFIMIYPLLWMVGASFKTNSEIFTSIGFIPKNPVFDGYTKLTDSYGGDITLFKSMINTYLIVVPKVIFTVVSAVITAYGFARFNFKGKNILFAVLISTLFLPQVVLNAPQYIMFTNFNWTNSYKPLIIPALFATDTYFVFMLIQFLRGVPKEMEESANIDGCNPVQTLLYIIVPVIKPAIVSCALFQFMWSSNDFMGPLIYLSEVKKYTASIFLRMSMDGEVGFGWNKILAASLVTILPSLIVFFKSQSSFVDGISAGSLKG